MRHLENAYQVKNQGHNVNHAMGIAYLYVPHINAPVSHALIKMLQKEGLASWERETLSHASAAIETLVSIIRQQDILLNTIHQNAANVAATLERHR